MSIPGLAFACGPLSGLQNKRGHARRSNWRGNLVAARAMNWGIDPFAGGAYSYVNPQTQEAPLAGLASPNGEAIFFCGEAFYRGKDVGTVEAALISELETARTARRRTSRARSLPASAGRTASSVCPDLNYERHRGCGKVMLDADLPEADVRQPQLLGELYHWGCANEVVKLLTGVFLALVHCPLQTNGRSGSIIEFYRFSDFPVATERGL
jgi:hypothetical protein